MLLLAAVGVDFQTNLGEDPCMDVLQPILDQLWSELQEAARTRHHGFHLPVLTTSDSSGSPDARVVVLRRIEVADRLISCHTDRRAPKVVQIAATPAVQWLFYDFDRRTQLRIRARAEVLTEGALFEEAWAGSSVESRRCYLAPHAPGAMTPGPSPNLPETHLTRSPTPEESEVGRDQFAVVRTVAHQIDWLHLASDGHRRARFDWTEGDGWTGQWLAP